MMIGVVVLLLAGGAVYFSSQKQAGPDDVAVITGRADAILAAWRDVKPPPKFDKTGNNLYSPTDWTITNVEVFGLRGRAVASVNSSTKGGVPVRVVWELRFTNASKGGWACTWLANTSIDYTPDEWKK